MEQEWICRARTGDSEAFGRLVRLYDRKAYKAAYWILRNEEESRDIVQEAFIRAFRNLSSFDPGRAFYPWLHRIVRNLCYNRTRNRNYRAVSLPDTEQESTMAGPEEALLAGETSREVREAVDRLPEIHREIILLKHFEDCSYKEIAEILEIPQGTVMSRLYNARKALKELLEI